MLSWFGPGLPTQTSRLNLPYFPLELPCSWIYLSPIPLKTAGIWIICMFSYSNQPTESTLLPSRATLFLNLSISHSSQDSWHLNNLHVFLLKPADWICLTSLSSYPVPESIYLTSLSRQLAPEFVCLPNQISRLNLSYFPLKLPCPWIYLSPLPLKTAGIWIICMFSYSNQPTESAWLPSQVQVQSERAC